MPSDAEWFVDEMWMESAGAAPGAVCSKQKAPPNGAFLARRRGFEPPTFGFVDQRSIQLSYRRTLAEKEGFEPSIGAFTPTLA